MAATYEAVTWPFPVAPTSVGAVHDEHSGTFLRLVQLWQHGGQFSLLLAAVDDSVYRDALVARLHGVAPAARIDLTADDTPQEWLQQLERAGAAGAQRVQVCLPISPPRSTEWWRQANVLRERLADAFPAPQLLWLSDAEVDTAAHQAPDLWNWREAVFEFSATPINPETLKVPESRFHTEGSADAAAVRARLLAIEDALGSIDADDAGGAYLLLEAAQAYERLGDWQAGEQAAARAGAAFRRNGNMFGQAQALEWSTLFRWRNGDAEGALKTLKADVLPVYERLGDLRSRAVTMGHIADILQSRGQLDEALDIRTIDELPIYKRLGDLRAKAIAMGKIADVLQTRGQLDEALRIREKEELPVFERYSDVRGRAITLGKIAAILQMRGQYDEALRIHQQEQLPIYERLGDIHSKAMTMGNIADILQSRGQLDEALRIRKEEVLPVYERLNEVRARAVTMGKIADILRAQGQLDEAFRIRKEEELPVYERLGDVHAKAITMGKIADFLQDHGQLDEALRIRNEEQIPVYERLGDVQAKAAAMGQVAKILEARGQFDEALRILQEEQLPVYLRLGNLHQQAVTLGQIASNLQARGQLDESLRIRKEEEVPLYERVGDARSKAFAIAKIADILQARGQLDEALRMHEERLASLTVLGDIDGQAHAKLSIARLMLDRGDHESGGAQVIQKNLAEAFAACVDSGRADGIAVIGTLLARVMAMRGSFDQALDILARTEAAYGTLGQQNGVDEVAAIRQAIDAQRPWNRSALVSIGS